MASRTAYFLLTTQKLREERPPITQKLREEKSYSLRNYGKLRTPPAANPSETTGGKSALPSETTGGFLRSFQLIPQKLRERAAKTARFPSETTGSGLGQEKPRLRLILLLLSLRNYGKWLGGFPSETTGAVKGRLKVFHQRFQGK